jgi:hypothetical protein
VENVEVSLVVDDEAETYEEFKNRNEVSAVSFPTKAFAIQRIRIQFNLNVVIQ